MPGGLVFFVDENALGLGKLLTREGRTDVLHPGHPELLEVPSGTPDLDWMKLVGARGYVVLTRDRRIRARPAELRAYWEHGIRSVWLGAKQDLTPLQQKDMFVAGEERLRREVTKRGPGPWALAMSYSGVRPMVLPEPRS